MKLDPQIAESIVSDLKDIIKHEINLFDTTGTIIASTDLSRIGTSHAGARKVISTKQPITIDDEEQYRGAKRGINLPVLFNDQVVAVIGITGERSIVEPFGSVIKKMTEILLRENWDQISKFDRRNHVTRLCEQLILPNADLKLCSYLASVVKIDLMRPRTCVVGRLSTPQNAQKNNETPYSVVQRYADQFKESFFTVDGREILIFVESNEQFMLKPILSNLTRAIETELKQNVVWGIGELAQSPVDYNISYEQATKTIKWLEFSKTSEVGSFDQLDYGIFISNLAKQESAMFVQRVLGKLTEKEMREFEELFDAYTRHNGSIIHTADQLFLHKNTLQNKLNKIAHKTGYNPRNLSDYAVLALALKIRGFMQANDTY